MGRATPNKKTVNTFKMADRGEKNKATANAAAALRPTLNAAVTIHQIVKPDFGELDLSGLLNSLGNQVKRVNQGNLGRQEALLVAQAHTLDAIFNSLTRRAVLNMGQYLDATDKYMRLALKAQS
jgi:fructose-1,6-bisphosphatase/sedoheptulose 1,7-bisphosphatase-like protein